MSDTRTVTFSFWVGNTAVIWFVTELVASRVSVQPEQSSSVTCYFNTAHVKQPLFTWICCSPNCRES